MVTQSRGSGQLTVDTQAVETEHQQSKAQYVNTPGTEASTPSTPTGNGDTSTPLNVRGRSDIRSPGVSKTPSVDKRGENAEETAPLPDFITQTDANGNSTTPRTEGAVAKAQNNKQNEKIPSSDKDETSKEQLDACDTLLDSLRMMCCCLLPEQEDVATTSKDKQVQVHQSTSVYPDQQPYFDTQQIKLLPAIRPEDAGKKCLVLDLDETLVHSSFRAVPGADFVIPVQIEDVVHYVYVAKRPGVDEFLIEMAKHYEIILYTASLNKYADPLLDLLDPHRTIRTRLFRESCVYYEGNYVKDLSLLDRDLSETIIVDNSPSSYIFHPENAIDCSSFIDDPSDRELDQIGSFLTGVKQVKDVRSVCSMWKEWPNIPRLDLLEYGPADETREDRQFN